MPCLDNTKKRNSAAPTAGRDWADTLRGKATGVRRVKAQAKGPNGDASGGRRGRGAPRLPQSACQARQLGVRRLAPCERASGTP